MIDAAGTYVAQMSREQLQLLLKDTADHLVFGGAKTFEAYCNRVGYAEGLRAAIAVIDDAERALQAADRRGGTR